jgi:hypothetical protein
MIELDTGAMREFASSGRFVAGLSDDGGTMLVSDDEGERYWIQDLEDLTITDAPWVTISNGASINDDFTTYASNSVITRPIAR